MNEPEMRPQRAPWAARASRWADGQVKNWALVLWTVGAGGGGLAAGIVAGSTISPDSIEAAGTWAGVFVGAGVGVVAYRAFVHGAYDQALARTAAQDRRRDELEERERREASDARRVISDVAFGSGYNLGMGSERVVANVVRINVHNQSEATAVNVTVTVHRTDGGEDIVREFPVVHPLKDAQLELALSSPLEMPEGGFDATSSEVEIEVAFTMHGARWAGLNNEPPVRIG